MGQMNQEEQLLETSIAAVETFSKLLSPVMCRRHILAPAPLTWNPSGAGTNGNVSKGKYPSGPLETGAKPTRVEVSPWKR